jgi:preprotein translocase subunit SecA
LVQQQLKNQKCLAQLLNEYKLSYQILNAKPENVRRESEIVAQAGKKEVLQLLQIWLVVEQILF